jgi:two-component system, NarL family, nitrate/nitrite response regulator NarL
VNRAIAAAEAASGVLTAARDHTALLADAETATRAGLRRVLEPHGLEVGAEASTAAHAVEAAVTTHPDVCVLDIRLPGDGIEAVRQIHRRAPDTRIVVLTSSADEEDLFAALRGGADGFLLKSMSTARLPSAIHSVLRGEAAFPRELTGQLVRELRNQGRGRRLTLDRGHEVELTPRESETLDQLRLGKSTAEIASYLQLSQVTVRRHLSTIAHKLGVPDRRSMLDVVERAERADRAR